MGKNKIDLKGIQIGYLIPKEYVGNGRWNCFCTACNLMHEVRTGELNRYLKNNCMVSCGCMQYTDRYEDLRNKKFNHLTVLNEDAIRKYNYPYWKCQCDCENQTIIFVRGSHLTHNEIKSCGCLLFERKLNDYELSGIYGIGYTEQGFEFYFDKEDFDKIKEYTWYRSSTGHILSHKSQSEKLLLLHRLIMDCPDDKVVDHIDNNPNNNTRSNLRICTELDNQHNKTIYKNNTSGITGIYQDGSKWRSSIFYNYCDYNLGSFNTLEEALIARLKKEKELVGEFSPNQELFEKYGI